MSQIAFKDTINLTTAEHLARSVKGCAAWNMPPAIRIEVNKTYKNQHGTLYVFMDQSRAYIAKGCAKIIAH